MNCSTYILGLMSGTSLDGVDAALIELENGTAPGRMVSHHYAEYPVSLRERLLALHYSGQDELHRAACIASELADLYAESVHAILHASNIRPSAIACHGQTIRHRPECGYSLQLMNGARLAERTGITVIADFRNRDIAAGGQGAPLVPAFHAAAFQHHERNRVIANIGGIANLTWLPTTGNIIGFDCGPGNILLDAWCLAHTGQSFDRDGAWGAQGQVLPELLERLSAHPYFGMHPPKSAGREQFNLEWVRTQLSGTEQPQDVQATLMELTALGITDAIRHDCPQAQELFLCGGGAHNTALLAAIQRQALQVRVLLTDTLGISADWLEAHAFAWLGWQTLQGLPGNCPDVTGASHPCILGAIYPA